MSGILCPVCRSVDGVPNSLARVHAIAATQHIERAARHIEAEAPLPRSAREAPDHAQLRGTPVIVLKTPPWRRQDWALPQTPPTRRRG